jgi:hypothetical protein
MLFKTFENPYKQAFFVLGTGLEPVRPLQSLDFKSSVSTNSTTQAFLYLTLSEKRDSNPRPQPWQGCALPTELFSQKLFRTFEVANIEKENNIIQIYF